MAGMYRIIGIKHFKEYRFGCLREDLLCTLPGISGKEAVPSDRSEFTTTPSGFDKSAPGDDGKASERVSSACIKKDLT
jgi:hypothetical protein